MGVLAISAHEALPRAQGLVEEAKKGDFSAYERLYRHHVGRIHAICLRMTADPDRAEDLTQQAFIRAWERLASFRGESEFGGWLRRVAINVVLSDRRSRSRRHELAVEDVEGLDQPDLRLQHGADVDLDSAITCLPARAREIFVLHDVEGYRHSEIGEMLDIAPGTSRSQLHRARMLLREALRS